MTQANSSRWTPYIIATVVLLVAGPVVIPAEIARWHIAAASNDLRNKDDEGANRHLHTALKWDSQAIDSLDFAVARLSRPLSDNPQQSVEELERAVAAHPQLAQRAIAFADQLADLGEFELALQCAKLAAKYRVLKRDSQLNQLAYFRALAEIELDIALKNIIEAKKIRPDDFQYEDTHAWVLHKIGRDIEALGYANQALMLLQKWNSEQQEKLAVGWPWGTTKSGEEQSKSSKVKDGAPGDRLAQYVESSEKVLRFHRYQILKSLKQHAAADADRAWLDAHGVLESQNLF